MNDLVLIEFDKKSYDMFYVTPWKRTVIYDGEIVSS